MGRELPSFPWQISGPGLHASGEKLEVKHYYVAPKTYALADKEAKRTVPADEYRNYPAYAYTTQVAVVEVNPETGKVKRVKDPRRSRLRSGDQSPEDRRSDRG